MFSIQALRYLSLIYNLRFSHPLRPIILCTLQLVRKKQLNSHSENLKMTYFCSNFLYTLVYTIMDVRIKIEKRHSLEEISRAWCTNCQRSFFFVEMKHLPVEDVNQTFNTSHNSQRNTKCLNRPSRKLSQPSELPKPARSLDQVGKPKLFLEHQGLLAAVRLVSLDLTMSPPELNKRSILAELREVFDEDLKSRISVQERESSIYPVDLKSIIN